MRRIAVLAVFLFTLTGFAAETHNRVLLIRPDATSRFMNEGDTAMALNYGAVFRNDLLLGGYYNTTEAPENALLGDLRKYDLIILPGTVCLDTTAWLEVKRFLNNGGGVLATWAISCRNGDGSWRGFRDLAELLGAEPLDTEIEIGKPAAIQLRFGTPITLNVPPGYYLRLSPTVVPMKVNVESKRDIAGYWATDGYFERDPSNIKREAGLIVRELPTGGRVVWFGANIDGMHADSVNREIYQPMFHQMFKWLMGASAVGVEAWPKGYQSAVIIHGDIEDQFANVENIIRLFEKYNVKTTFNLLVEEGMKYPNVIKMLVKNGGELGLHGDTHDRFGEQSLDQQVQRLKRAIEYVSTVSDRPTGFRPPELSYNQFTMTAVRMTGLDYLMADDLPDRDYPRWRPDAPGALEGLVTYPKGELDDYDLVDRFKISDAATMSAIMIKDFERIHDMRGLYRMNYHSQMLSKPELTMVVEQVIKELLQHDDIWIATTREVTNWMKAREALRVATLATDSSLKFMISNRSDKAIENVVLRVAAPRSIPVEQMMLASISKSCTYDVRDSCYIIYLPKLKANDEFTALLVKGSGGLYNQKTRDLPFKFFKLAFIIAAIFLGGALYYFFFSRRSEKSLLTADGKPLDFDKHDTGIYGAPSPMRSSLPAPAPEEENVEAFRTSVRMYAGLQPTKNVKKTLDKSGGLPLLGVPETDPASKYVYNDPGLKGGKPPIPGHDNPEDHWK